MNTVSLITGCYNGEKFIGKCFNSILEQTYPNIEVIFVDDGSTDNSLEIAKTYKSKFLEKGFNFLIVSQKNMGFYPQSGIKISTGKYITTLDIDDILLPESIQKRANLLEKNPEYAVSRSNGYVVYQHDESPPSELLINDPENENENVFENLVFAKTTNIPGTYMVRADVLFEYYPDKIVPMDRYTQNLQILLPVTHNRKVGFVSEILMHYYRHDKAFTADKIDYESRFKQFESFKRVRKDLLKMMNLLSPEIEAKLDRTYETVFLGLAKKYNAVKEFNTLYRTIKFPTYNEKLLYASINKNKMTYYFLKIQNKLGLLN